MNIPKQISISIESCCEAIFKGLNGDADPKRDKVLTTQCKKFDLDESFIKKLIFIKDDRIDERYARKKRKREKPEKFLN